MDKATLYEGLLERNAGGSQVGRRQYFTSASAPTRAIVEAMRPEAGMKICDPACVRDKPTVAAYEGSWRAPSLRDLEQRNSCASTHLKGWEIVEQHGAALVMNLLLHRDRVPRT